MRRALHLLVLLPLASVAPAGAQARIDIGQTVLGDLSVSDMRGTTGEFHDYWQFPAEAGSIYIVTLRSEDFDPALVAGPARGDECHPCDWDDDGGGGTDARLELWVREAGPYVIRASSFDGGRGRYTLRLEQADEGFDPTVDTIASPGEPIPATEAVLEPAVADHPASDIPPNEEVRGRLEPGDARSDEGRYEDVWTYHGAAGEQVTLSMRSEELDAFLFIGRWVDGTWRELARNDDYGGGTDSELEVTLPDEGPWEIHATSREGEGAYTLLAWSELRLGAAPAPARGVPPAP